MQHKTHDTLQSDSTRWLDSKHIVAARHFIARSHKSFSPRQAGVALCPAIAAAMLCSYKKEYDFIIFPYNYHCML